MATVYCPKWPTTAQPGFWGVNEHITWSSSGQTNGNVYTAANDAARVSAMLDMGCKVSRSAYSLIVDGSGNITGDPSARFLSVISTYAASGILVAPCLIPYNLPTIVTSESIGYTYGFALGQNAATKLQGLVPWYEIGNEMEAVPGNKVIQTGTGRNDTDYDTTKFRIFRGIFYGMVDGILSVDPVTPMVYFNSTYQHTGFGDMMIKGREPTSGGAVVGRTLNIRTQDKLGHHWYANNNTGADDILNSQGFNVLAFLAQYGRPIYITECGATWNAYGLSESAVNAATFTSSLVIDRIFANRLLYNVQHISFYQLYDSASGLGVSGSNDEMNFALSSAIGSPKTRYTTYKNFIAANR